MSCMLCTGVAPIQATVAQFKRGWDGYMYIYHGLSNSQHNRGGPILISKDLNCNPFSSHSGKHGRMILINVDIDNQNLLLSIFIMSMTSTLYSLDIG